MWHWTERKSGEFVGQVGLQHADIEGRRRVEIDWTLMPAHWGKGYATEAASAVLAHAYEGDRSRRDRLLHPPPQQGRPRRVMEKIGLAYRGRPRRSSARAVPHRRGRRPGFTASRARNPS